MSELKPDFLIELAKACLVKSDILSVVRPHLQYSYISNKDGPYKEIFKYIFDYHAANNAAPTMGMLVQNITAKEALPIIGRIREANIFDTKDQIVATFEDFIRRARFADLYKQVEGVFNKGDVDKAVKMMANESASINKFSLKRQMHAKIFEQFPERQRKRQERDFSLKKIPTGIPQFDYHTRGGFDRGTALLIIGRSGSGKTTALRSLGAHAAFRGINVLHLASGDSTQEEIEDGYDAWWTGIDLNDLREGKYAQADLKKIEQARKSWMGQAGEIYVHAFKQFNSASISDCRSILVDLLQENDIGLVLFDYLEKFNPGDGQRYDTNDESNRLKKLAVAEKIVNIATEFNVGAATATQSNEVPMEIWNSPDRVITRSNIANLKATIDPFPYCFTLNQTDDESDNEVMRIHEEKLRHYKMYSFLSTYHIAQRRDKGRFIDVNETNRLFWDAENKRITGKYIAKPKVNETVKKPAGPAIVKHKA